ncbi:MAG: hypothetical protein H6941_16705 [Candidatus Accumulibacter sp.]|nr:hypothetical protein [Accumulibacter sp.]
MDLRGHRDEPVLSLRETREDLNPIDIGGAAEIVGHLRPTAHERRDVKLRQISPASAPPDDVKRAIAKTYGQNAERRGVLYKGEAYLVADQHEPASDVEEPILHATKVSIGDRIHCRDLNTSLAKATVARNNTPTELSACH